MKQLLFFYIQSAISDAVVLSGSCLYAALVPFRYSAMDKITELSPQKQYPSMARCLFLCCLNDSLASTNTVGQGSQLPDWSLRSECFHGEMHGTVAELGTLAWAMMCRYLPYLPQIYLGADFFPPTAG
jgi:hypothetical protein